MAPTTTRRRAARTPPKRRIDLALQGGGSHGAFTWGVLDRLLEEEWLEIAGVSGTSAGAMNAVALAAGADGRRPGRCPGGLAALLGEGVRGLAVCRAG